MKLYFLILLFVLCQNKSEEIIWTKDRKLIWDDFKGRPDVNSKFNAVADCHVKWNVLTKKDTVIINVISFMNTNSSWVKNTEFGNAYLLKHEQQHFNVAELFARRFRQNLINRKLPKTGIGNEIRKIYDSVEISFKKYQDAYDAETDHSKNKKKQEEWEKVISKEIQALDTYSNTVIIKFR